MLSIIYSTTCSSISLSAISCIVHRERPPGGDEQAIGIILPSTSKVTFLTWYDCGFLPKAASTPSSTKRFAIPATVARVVLYAACIRSYVQCSFPGILSSFSKICACFMRYPFPPFCMVSSQSLRSSSVKVTLYLGIFLPPHNRSITFLSTKCQVCFLAALTTRKGLYSGLEDKWVLAYGMFTLRG